MKGKKIINVHKGSDDDDAAIKQDIRETTNFLTNFLFTTDLKHDNEKIVKFPPNLKTINDDTTGSRMTTGNTIQNYITFYTGGGALFHIMYNDFYKGGGTFKISAKIYNGDTFIDYYSIGLNNQTNWTPLSINAIINIPNNNKLDPDYHYVKLHFVTSNGSLDGSGYSSFYSFYIKRITN